MKESMKYKKQLEYNSIKSKNALVENENKIKKSSEFAELGTAMTGTALLEIKGVEELIDELVILESLLTAPKESAA